ncbi:MAG: hypothetical protein IJC82_01845 [Firmicutes bacterium]|nr:hypothetical protein [Bacillota bacterium]
MAKKEYDSYLIRSFLILLFAVFSLFAVPDIAFAAAEKLPLMERSGILSIFYGIIMVLSLLLTVGYFVLVRNRDIWFLLLFTSVLIVNTGYFLLSVSSTLSEAMWANRLSYLGSVFLPFIMLMVIMNVCHVTCKKPVRAALIVLGFAMFLLTASGGIFPWYYESVSLGSADGISILVKDYGPLHSIYLVYLLGYFAAMIAVIVQSALRKKLASYRHAMILLCLVLANICVWFFEQKILLHFEFLSVSYILTELFLLLLYYMLQDYEFRTRAASSEPVPFGAECVSEDGDLDDLTSFTEDWSLRVMEHSALRELLTGREQEVVKLILENKRRKDIAEILHVSENTVKKHTSHIFAKMNVANRKELLLKLEEYMKTDR